MLDAKEYIKTFTAEEDYNPKMLGEEGLITLASGYLNPGETPKNAIQRVARTTALELGMPELYDRVMHHVWNGNIGLSSPVWSNFGSQRGLPISCFGTYVDDSISSIYEGISEVAMMSKMGGGTSAFFGPIRGRGVKIAHGQGKSNGVKSFLKNYDSMIQEVSQGGVRRGSAVAYLPFSHPDVLEFLNIREVGDDIQSIMTAITISDKDVEDILAGENLALEVWAKIIEIKNNTGTPYLLYVDNANNHSSTPVPYGTDRYKISASNLCSEIMLPSSPDESFVCCLLSMNVERYDKWKDSDAVEVAIYMMEAIMNEFIRKAGKIKEMARSVKFAERHRALGLGIFGWHTFLQQRMIPFTSLMAEGYTKLIMEDIKTKADAASAKLADTYGPCEVNAEYGIHMRHTTRLAIAPTTTNAMLCNVTSPGIECLSSNMFARKVSKGSFIWKNPELMDLLSKKQMNTREVWTSIGDKDGSVQHLDFLSPEEKEVFLTSFEINQFGIIKQASIRQMYLDQGQSLNLFILPDTPAKLRSKLFLTAHKYGLKAIYYQRSLSVNKVGVIDGNSQKKKSYAHIWQKSMDSGCEGCEG